MSSHSLRIVTVANPLVVGSRQNRKWSQKSLGYVDWGLVSGWLLFLLPPLFLSFPRLCIDHFFFFFFFMVIKCVLTLGASWYLSVNF